MILTLLLFISFFIIQTVPSLKIFPTPQFKKIFPPPLDSLESQFKNFSTRNFPTHHQTNNPPQNINPYDPNR